MSKQGGQTAKLPTRLSGPHKAFCHVMAKKSVPCSLLSHGLVSMLKSKEFVAYTSQQFINYSPPNYPNHPRNFCPNHFYLGGVLSVTKLPI